MLLRPAGKLYFCIEKDVTKSKIICKLSFVFKADAGSHRLFWFWSSEDRHVTDLYLRPHSRILAYLMLGSLLTLGEWCVKDTMGDSPFISWKCISRTNFWSSNFKNVQEQKYSILILQIYSAASSVQWRWGHIHWHLILLCRNNSLYVCWAKWNKNRQGMVINHYTFNQSHYLSAAINRCVSHSGTWWKWLIQWKERG